MATPRAWKTFGASLRLRICRETILPLTEKHNIVPTYIQHILHTVGSALLPHGEEKERLDAPRLEDALRCSLAGLSRASSYCLKETKWCCDIHIYVVGNNTHSWLTIFTRWLQLDGSCSACMSRFCAIWVLGKSGPGQFRPRGIPAPMGNFRS